MPGDARDDMKRFSVISAAAALLIAACLIPAPAAGGAALSEEREILAVTVYGNENIDRDLVVGVLGVSPGDTYRKREVMEGIARLKELAGIRYVTHRTVPVAGGRGVYLVITITGEKTWSVRPKLTRNFADRIAFGGAFEERNLRGLNERLYASVLVRAATIVEIEWSKYDFSGARWLGVGAGIEYSRYNWPWPSFPGLADEDDPIVRFDAFLKATIRPLDLISVYLAPGLAYMESAGYEGYVPAVSKAPEGTFTTLEIGMDLKTAGRTFYPESGIAGRVSARRWGILQKDPALDVTRIRVEAAAFTRLGPVWPAIAVRGSYTADSLPYYLYEHIGGVSTVRGYERGTFFGENSLVLRLDLRIPLNFDEFSELGNPVILTALDIFADTGAAWNGEDLPGVEAFHSGTGAALDFIAKEGWLLRAGHAWPMDTDGRWFVDVGKDF